MISIECGDLCKFRILDLLDTGTGKLLLLLFAILGCLDVAEFVGVQTRGKLSLLEILEYLGMMEVTTILSEVLGNYCHHYSKFQNFQMWMKSLFLLVILGCSGAREIIIIRNSGIFRYGGIICSFGERSNVEEIIVTIIRNFKIFRCGGNCYCYLQF